MQLRWHRRRMNSMNRPGPCRRPHRGWGSGGPSMSPSFHPSENRGWGSGRGRGHNGGGRNRGAAVFRGDAELKEAIRRSLQDVTSNQDNSESEAKTTKLEDNGEASLLNKSDVTQDKNEPVENTKEKSSQNSEEKGTEEQNLNQEEKNPTDILGTDKGDVISELSSLSSVTNEAEKVEATDATGDEKKADEDKETDQANKDLADNVTDSENAIDNAASNEGDTDAPAEQKTSTVNVIVNGKDDTESATASEEMSDDQKASTGTIVADGDEDVEENTQDEKASNESVASEEGWQVVPGEMQDEMIARAAQLLGSALFESDLHNSENISASNMSVPSSVPSLASDSNISPVVLDKWAVHLNQLHELGFHADKKSVEILERLTAANIGVDSEDEVSVTQVVNELLKT